LWTLLLVLSVGFQAVGDDKPFAKSNDSSITTPAAITPPVIGSETGQSWTGNRLAMELLWCEPGRFMMGSPTDEPGRKDDEDQVQVTLTKGFWLGKFEVTQEQWHSVMNTEPWLDHRRVRVAPDSPACWVSWEQSDLFCKELSRLERESGNLPEGWDYVLPTEAQWEYACRAGSTSKFSFGDDDEKLFDYAWYGEQDRQPQQMHARAVGQKKPNPWGFFDMHGNVVEWCRDCYRSNYPGGKNPLVRGGQRSAITGRGGEWRLPLKWSRSACRQRIGRSGTAATIGFRVSLQRGAVRKSKDSPPMTLAVVRFENKGRSVAHDRLGRAFSGLMAGTLSKYAGLDVLERQSIQGLQQESTLANQEKTQGGPSGRLRQSANYMLTGSYSVSDNRLRITARLGKPGLGKPVGEWTLSGEIEELLNMEAELSAKLISALKVGTKLKSARSAGTSGTPVIAVLPLANNSPTSRLDDLQIGFAELLQAALAEEPEVRLVERQAIERILSEQNLTESGFVDPSTAIEIGRLAGANTLLVGSFLELGPQLSVQVRLINSRTGAVVASEHGLGATNDLGTIVDNLSLQLTDRLTAAPANPAMKSKVGSRGTLEASQYAAAAERYKREGNMPKAVEAWQQAVLLEPRHPVYRVNLMRLQYDLNDYTGAIRTGEQGLALPKESWTKRRKTDVLLWLSYSYRGAGRYDDLQRLLERYGHISQRFSVDVTSMLAEGLVQQRRFPDAAALMEATAEKDVARHGVLKSSALKKLFQFHLRHTVSVVGIPVKDHQDSSRRAIEIYERVLEAASRTPNDDTTEWVRILVPHAVKTQIIGDDNIKRPYLSPARIAEFQRREQEAFSLQPEIKFDASYELGIASEEKQSWDAAVEAYRHFLELTPDISFDYVQPLFGNNGTLLRDWSDKRIEAQFRVSSILATKLNREEEARQSYQTLVQEYGVSHFAGPDTLVDMHRLNVTPEIPADCALVWGGSTSNLNGWRKMLAAENLSLHAVRKGEVTLADLAPYRVVIVNKSSDFPFLPSEVMALRTYVASGGSLLLIVSPIWSVSAPMLHNSLLSWFDMQADSAPITNGKSTQILPHPITRGIESFTAHHAVGLDVPKNTALIKVRENTVLAARDYRRGRVVIAAIGQWYTPEILVVPEILKSKRKTVPSGSGPDNLGHIRGTEREPALLRQVLRWLGEPHELDQPFEDWRQEWLAALFAFSQAQALISPAELRIREWDELPGLFDRLIADAPDHQLREESLWTAGECLLHNGRFHDHLGTTYERTHLYERHAGRFRFPSLILSCDQKFFRRLVDDYGDSSLQACAQWRLADAKRMKDPRRGRDFDASDKDDVLKLTLPFNALNLKKGTFPDAWNRLQSALLLFAIDEFEQAAAGFDEVAESMPASAEKANALLNSARSYIMLGDFNEARRRLSQLEQTQNISWQAFFDYYNAESRTAFEFLSRIGNADSRYLGPALEQRMLEL
jgi:formylglycine-generating enzyme required for sulfatase activity/tetratricopeptide (TPR) repeat protein/TolB-like protein